MSDVPNDLATLISEVRHEANNSLMAIFGYIELALARDDVSEGVVLKLKGIEAEAYKIRDHIARTSFIRRPGG